MCVHSALIKTKQMENVRDVIRKHAREAVNQ